MEIWRELSLIGHWISDALILRWTELTSQISKKCVTPSEIINLLLTVPIPERDVADVKDIYLKSDVKECAWTGISLKNRFDIDHVIPFSLWRNNDLWNLLPVDSEINREKRDKLPTRSLLLKRKDCIIRYWKLLRTANKYRFDFEVYSFTGLDHLSIGGNLEPKMFNHILEAVEITAMQRGCERWEP